MLSTLLAAAHHDVDLDLEGLVFCLLVAVIVGVLAYVVCAVLARSIVPPLGRFAGLIALCVGALAFLACWF